MPEAASEGAIKSPRVHKFPRLHGVCMLLQVYIYSLLIICVIALTRVVLENYAKSEQNFDQTFM